jgi:lambda family phage portal protein
MRKDGKLIGRVFDSALFDRLRNDWITNSFGPNAELEDAIRTLRERSRDLERNSEIMRKYLQLQRQNILGHEGIKLQMRLKRPDGKLDKERNTAIEQAFKAWARSKNVALSGNANWMEVQDLVLRTARREGEAFVKPVMLNENGTGRLALQLLEGDFVDERVGNATAHKLGDKDNHNRVKLGIEVDAWDRRVAYWVSVHHPGEHLRGTGTAHGSTNTIIQNGRAFTRVPADQVLHVYRAERFSQLRGFPNAAAVLTKIHWLRGYQEAELTAARVGAAKMGFITTDTGDESAGADLEDNGLLEFDVEPGTFRQLNADQKVETFDPNHPNNQYEAFVRGLTREVAIGLELNYVTLSSDLSSVNFSSLRHGSAEERDNWRVLQTWFRDSFLTPVFERWLELAILNRSVPVRTGEFDVVVNSANWQCRGFEYIDPDKESKADLAQVNMGTKSITMIAAERGRNLDDVLDEIAAEKEAFEERGLKHPTELDRQLRPVDEGEEPEQEPDGSEGPPETSEDPPDTSEDLNRALSAITEAFVSLTNELLTTRAASEPQAPEPFGFDRYFLVRNGIPVGLGSKRPDDAERLKEPQTFALVDDERAQCIGEVERQAALNLADAAESSLTRVAKAVGRVGNNTLYQLISRDGEAVNASTS